MIEKEFITDLMVSLKASNYSRRDDPERKWTIFMTKRIGEIADKMNCYPVMRRNKKCHGEYSGEYLNIDVMFFGNKNYKGGYWEKKDMDPPALPVVVVEHENSYKKEKIIYCLWKLLCVRSQFRILICYQNKGAKINNIVKYLASIINQYDLYNNDKGKLLVLIGDDSKVNIEWEDYFSAFYWNKNKLVELIEAG